MAVHLFAGGLSAEQNGPEPEGSIQARASVENTRNENAISLTVDPAPPDASTTGFYLLTWGTKRPGGNRRTSGGTEQAPVYLVEESAAEDFSSARVIYTGSDTATTMSGKKNGTYYYRVSGPGNASSNVVRVRVEHHPMSRAFTFLAIGGVVFLLTVILIFAGQSGLLEGSRDA